MNSIESDLCGIKCSFTERHKSFPMQCGLSKFLISLLHIYTALNTMKLNISFICTEACFAYRITQKISDILWVILEKCLICIFNCISWFVSIFTYLYCTMYNEIKYFIHLYRSMFRIQDHTKDF